MSEALEDGTPTRVAVQCSRCHGWLVSPSSVDARIGPVCAQHARVDAQRKAQEIPLFDLKEVR